VHLGVLPRFHESAITDPAWVQGFADVCKAVGVPYEERGAGVTADRHGRVDRRHRPTGRAHRRRVLPLRVRPEDHSARVETQVLDRL
jgi:hypothetical protein